MKKNIIHTSKYISKLLRHDTEDLSMDKNGWILVKDLLIKVNIDKITLDLIVITDDKNRFSYNDTKTMIRANQGHTIDVDLEFEEVLPPEFLYHGTSSNVLEVIMKYGLISMKRKFVHLSKDEQTAISVGDRHTKSNTTNTVILKIKSGELYKNGYKIFLSKNGVYLMEKIPKEYIEINKYIS